MARAKVNELSHRDREDLEWYAGELAHLAIRGQSYEQADHGGDEPTTPTWLRSYSRLSGSAQARAIWRRLHAASAACPGADGVLLALHDPAAVVLDGATTTTDEEIGRVRADPRFRLRERLDVGRRLAVYPLTPTAREARRWCGAAGDLQAVGGLERGLRRLHGTPGRPGPVPRAALAEIGAHVALRGRRPADALAQLGDAKRRARGEVAQLWGQVDAEARELVVRAVAAWHAAGDHRAPRELARTDVIAPRGSAEVAQ